MEKKTSKMAEETTKEQKVKLMLAKKTREYEDILDALSSGVTMDKLAPNASANYLGYKIPLISALASNSNLELLEDAVANGGDVNIRDAKDITPLMYAVQPIQGEVSEDVVKFLVENGADVNARRKSEYVDESVLTRATAFASVEVIKYLLEHGASKSLRLADIKEYQKSIHSKDIEIYDQVQSVGPAFRTNTKSMSPFLIKKIERYKEICSVLSEAYNQKTAKKAAAKEEQPKEM